MTEEFVYYPVRSGLDQIGVVIAPNREMVLAKLSWLTSKPGTVLTVIELRDPAEADRLGLDP